MVPSLRKLSTDSPTQTPLKMDFYYTSNAFFNSLETFEQSTCSNYLVSPPQMSSTVPITPPLSPPENIKGIYDAIPDNFGQGIFDPIPDTFEPLSADDVIDCVEFKAEPISDHDEESAEEEMEVLPEHALKNVNAIGLRLQPFPHSDERSYTIHFEGIDDLVQHRELTPDSSASSDISSASAGYFNQPLEEILNFDEDDLLGMSDIYRPQLTIPTLSFEDEDDDKRISALMDVETDPLLPQLEHRWRSLSGPSSQLNDSFSSQKESAFSMFNMETTDLNLDYSHFSMMCPSTQVPSTQVLDTIASLGKKSKHLQSTIKSDHSYSSQGDKKPQVDKSPSPYDVPQPKERASAKEALNNIRLNSRRGSGPAVPAPEKPKRKGKANKKRAERGRPPAAGRSVQNTNYTCTMTDSTIRLRTNNVTESPEQTIMFRHPRSSSPNLHLRHNQQTVLRLKHNQQDTRVPPMHPTDDEFLDDFEREYINPQYQRQNRQPERRCSQPGPSKSTRGRKRKADEAGLGHSGTMCKSESKREQHNNSEKKRRHRIKNSLTRLDSVLLPDDGNHKRTRNEILIKGRDHLANLRHRVAGGQRSGDRFARQITDERHRLYTTLRERHALPELQEELRELIKELEVQFEAAKTRTSAYIEASMKQRMRPSKRSC